MPPEAALWSNLKQRCLNPKNPGYRNYGGRGILICEAWRKDFWAFYRDMGPRPSTKHSLDRIDNDGDYEPSNCRWATQAQQNRNCRRTKLTESAVAEIRGLLAQNIRVGAIAHKYRVAPSTIYDIRNGRNWA